MVGMKGRGNKVRSRGYRAERELVATLWRLGFAVMRAPASGARIKRADYPDIVAIKDGKVIVLEVKRRSELTNIYMSKEQYEKLMNFTRRAGGRAFIAVKIPYKDWIFIEANKLQEMSNGKYRLSKEDIINGLKLHEVLKQVGIKVGIEEFMS